MEIKTIPPELAAFLEAMAEKRKELTSLRDQMGRDPPIELQAEYDKLEADLDRFEMHVWEYSDRADATIELIGALEPIVSPQTFCRSQMAPDKRPEEIQDIGSTTLR